MLLKFRKWMNYDGPPVRDMDGWNEFEDKFKKEAPIRYFIKYYIVLKINDVFDWVGRKAWGLRYRFYRKYHLVDTKLESGYHEIDTRMLHANFELLVDYVEIECSNMVLISDRHKEEIKHPWAHNNWPPILKRKTVRSRELGMQHLHWETTLNSTQLTEFERNPGQAARAVQIIILYTWWKDVYPNREQIPSPDKNSIGLEFLSKKWKKANPEMSAKIDAWSRNMYEQELDWDKEEEEMLIALMKIRKGLWT